MQKIHNKFFDVLFFIFSFFVSFFRSIGKLLGFSKTIKKGVFFQSIDFIFRLWPASFWNHPSAYKIGLFISSFIKYVFYNKK